MEVFGLRPQGHTPISAILNSEDVPFAQESLTRVDKDRFASCLTPRCTADLLCGISAIYNKRFTMV